MKKFLLAKLHSFHKGIATIENLGFVGFVYYAIIAFLALEFVYEILMKAQSDKFTLLDGIGLGFFMFIFTLFFLGRVIYRCRHDYQIKRSFYGDEINAHNGKRSLWVCKKCGKKHFGNYVDKLVE